MSREAQQRLVDAGRRFAERARAHRRLSRRRAYVVAAVVVALAVIAWGLLWSPLLAVRDVEVVGAERIPAAQVAELAQGLHGVPLARARTRPVEGAVEALVGVREATVERVWPSTVRVSVVERVPIAAVRAEQGFQVLDRDGVVLDTLPEAPSGVPLVQVDVASAGSRTLREVVAVLSSLPDSLRARVTDAGATTQDSVTLTLDDGATVVWGSADESARKARVIEVLVKTPAKVYDVSAPDMPVTSS